MSPVDPIMSQAAMQVSQSSADFLVSWIGGGTATIGGSVALYWLRGIHEKAMKMSEQLASYSDILAKQDAVIASFADCSRTELVALERIGHALNDLNKSQERLERLLDKALLK